MTAQGVGSPGDQAQGTSLLNVRRHERDLDEQRVEKKKAGHGSQDHARHGQDTGHREMRRLAQREDTAEDEQGAADQPERRFHEAHSFQ